MATTICKLENIMLGNQCDEVLLLQELLAAEDNEAIKYTGKLNGYFGYITLASAKAFKKINNLPEGDRLITTDFWKKLIGI